MGRVDQDLRNSVACKRKNVVGDLRGGHVSSFECILMCRGQTERHWTQADNGYWTDSHGRQTLHPASKDSMEVRLHMLNVKALKDVCIVLISDGAVGVNLGDNEWPSSAWFELVGRIGNN